MTIVIKTELAEWREKGYQSALARKTFDSLESEQEEIDTLPESERGQATRVLAMGWIEGMESLVFGVRGALAQQWESKGRAAGELDAMREGPTTLEGLCPMTGNDLAVDLEAMTVDNRIDTTEAMLIGYVRGYVSDVRERVKASGAKP
jgi:hypothetical protein